MENCKWATNLIFQNSWRLESINPFCKGSTGVILKRSPSKRSRKIIRYDSVKCRLVNALQSA